MWWYIDEVNLDYTLSKTFEFETEEEARKEFERLKLENPHKKYMLCMDDGWELFTVDESDNYYNKD